MRVAVVGAGVVGCAIALTLRRRGAEVVLIDRDAPGSGCSSGNSGAISPGSVVPLAMPGVLASVPSMLLDDESPLYLPLAYLPRALPWLLRFVAAARPSRVAKVAARLDLLHKNALQMHREMACDIGVPELFLERGHLHLYPDAGALVKDAAGWRLRKQYGWNCEQLDRGAIEALEPNAPNRYGVGMYVADHATILNPQRYVQAMAQAFVAAGGKFCLAMVSAIERDGSSWRLRGALESATADNGTLFDQVVVAAGAWSRALLDPLGIPIPLESQRGYHVQFAGVHDLVSRTVILADRKVFVTPMEEGVRVGGTVEIGGLTRAPDSRRAALLQRIARESFPSLESVDPTTWMGHRPCTPDSLPVVGSAKGMVGLWLAVGHGHLGMTDSLPTAKKIADEMLGHVSGSGR
ncbi:MAG: FAD-dependent oxidoreductase [Rhodoferax sp.]|nr:FAD-dependent oxidoreductase [Rhodoferax sp.]